MTLQEREQHVKQWVNDLRKQAGHRALAKLKRGIPDHYRCCTISESMRDKDGHWIKVQHNHVDKEIAQFMRDFDAGKYPHLELPKTSVKIRYPGQRKSTVIE